MTDKLWAQLIVPPLLTLVWLLIGSHILKLARPGGDLDKARSKLNWYGAAVLLAVRVKVLVVVVVAGLKEAVTPLGSPEADSATPLLNPF